MVNIGVKKRELIIENCMELIIEISMDFIIVAINILIHLSIKKGKKD